MSYLKNSTVLTSNSLAIVTWINKAAITMNLRHLLSLPYHNEEPNWLHSKDRKLLQTDNLKKKVDIVVEKMAAVNIKEFLLHLNMSLIKVARGL